MCVPMSSTVPPPRSACIRHASGSAGSALTPWRKRMLK